MFTRLQHRRISRGDRGYIPSNIWQGGGLCYHPPMLWKVNNILTYLYKYSDKINRLLWMNLAKVPQKFLPKCKILVSQVPSKELHFFYSSSALNLSLKVFTKLHDSSCKNAKFSSFLGGHIPSDPPARLGAQLALTRHQIIPPPQISKTDIHRRWATYGLTSLEQNELLVEKW